MTAEEFRSWQAAMGISARKAAELLDVKPDTVSRYRLNGATKIVALACRALYHRLEPWK